MLSDFAKIVIYVAVKLVDNTINTNKFYTFTEQTSDRCG